MRYLLPLFLFCQILILCPALAETGTGDPADLPATIQTAIDGQDSALALGCLDLDSLVETLLNKNLPLINEQIRQGRLVLNPPLALALAAMNAAGPASGTMVKNFLTAELRKFIVYGVESGSFAGRPLDKDRLHQMDGGVFSHLGQISTARKVLGPAILMEQDEDSALVRTELFDAGARRSYPLELRLQKKQDQWQINEIENVEELARTLTGNQQPLP